MLNSRFCNYALPIFGGSGDAAARGFQSWHAASSRASDTTSTAAAGSHWAVYHHSDQHSATTALAFLHSLHNSSSSSDSSDSGGSPPPPPTSWAQLAMHLNKSGIVPIELLVGGMAAPPSDPEHAPAPPMAFAPHAHLRDGINRSSEEWISSVGCARAKEPPQASCVLVLLYVAAGGYEFKVGGGTHGVIDSDSHTMVFLHRYGSGAHPGSHPHIMPTRLTLLCTQELLCNSRATQDHQDHSGQCTNTECCAMCVSCRCTLCRRACDGICR